MRRLLFVAAVLVIGGWWAYSRTVARHDVPPEPQVERETFSDRPTAVLQLLARLEVKAPMSKTGYSADAFGRGWADIDGNGCDTRNEILGRDLVDVTFRAGTDDCVVESGALHDPYTGATVAFPHVEVDHVVAMVDAWRKGAKAWDLARRTRFANDPDNLLTVSDDAHRAKGDADAAAWLPTAAEARCDYVARQVTVKASYGLWVTAAEREAMQRVLAGCHASALG